VRPVPPRAYGAFYSGLVGCWLATLACSGATDVVGVLDDTTTATESIASAAPSPDEALAVVQGRPLPDWRGEVLDWPLAVPLRELFAGDAATSGAPRAVGFAGQAAVQQRVPARWSRATRRFSRTTFEGEPSLARADDQAARAARGRSGPDAMRSVVLRGDSAEKLLSLFGSDAARAGSPGGMPPAAVVRDESGDVYQIVLDIEADAAAMDGASFDGAWIGAGSAHPNDDSSDGADDAADDCSAKVGRACMAGESSH
jgi:hypothetical protein